MPAKLIALEEFSRVFSYNPETGEITWKAASGRGRPGDRAGTPKVVRLWENGKVELTLVDETTEAGPISINEVPEGPVVGPDPLPLSSVSKLRAQVATLREALVGLCDSQLSSRDRESAIANGLSALEATKEGA